MSDGITNDAERDGRTQRRIGNAAKIYDAAIRLLGRYSFRDLSVEDICDEAGVGRATFFRIFGTKSGLLREFNRQMTERIRERLAAEEAHDAATSLRIVADEIADSWTQAGPGVAEMAVEYLHAVGMAEGHHAHLELLALVVEIVEEGIAHGEIRSASPAELTGGLALSQIAGTAAYWFEHPDTDLKGMTREAIETWLGGALRARPGSSRRR